MPYVKKFNIEPSKSPSQIIEDINTYLRKCSKLRRIHSDRIAEIDSLTLPAVNLKRKLEEQLIEVQHLKPAGKPKSKSPQRKSQSLNSFSGSQIYSMMTEEQKEAVKRELLGG